MLPFAGLAVPFLTGAGALGALAIGVAVVRFIWTAPLFTRDKVYSRYVFLAYKP